MYQRSKCAVKIFPNESVRNCSIKVCSYHKLYSKLDIGLNKFTTNSDLNLITQPILIFLGIFCIYKVVSNATVGRLDTLMTPIN